MLFGLRVWLYAFPAQRRLPSDNSTSTPPTPCTPRGVSTRCSGRTRKSTAPRSTPPAGRGSPLARLSAEQLRARFDLGALWRHAWRVDSVELTRNSTPTLASNNATPAVTHPAPRDDPNSRAGARTHRRAGRTRPGFFAGLLPNRFEIGEVRVNDFSLAWNAGRPADAGRLRGVDAHGPSAEPPTTAPGRSTAVTARLSQASFPALRLSTFGLRTTPREVFITHAEGRADVGGRVELTGTQALDADRALDLRADFDGIPIAGFLPADWRARLHGARRAAACTSSTPTTSPAARGRPGHAELRDGRLTALPVLNETRAVHGFRTLPRRGAAKRARGLRLARGRPRREQPAGGERGAPAHGGRFYGPRRPDRRHVAGGSRAVGGALAARRGHAGLQPARTRRLRLDDGASQRSGQPPERGPDRSVCSRRRSRRSSTRPSRARGAVIDTARGLLDLLKTP